MQRSTEPVATACGPLTDVPTGLTMQAEPGEQLGVAQRDLQRRTEDLAACRKQRDQLTLSKRGCSSCSRWGAPQAHAAESPARVAGNLGEEAGGRARSGERQDGTGGHQYSSSSCSRVGAEECPPIQDPALGHWQYDDAA